MPDLSFVRRCLLLILLGSFVGLLGELLLTEHTEDAFQLTPVVLLAVAVPVIGLAAWRRGLPLRLFQYLMVTFLVAGLIGGWQHYTAKREIALERSPELTGLTLLRKSLEGSTPPLLAPGAMVALGLLGLTWTYRQGAPS